MSVGTRPLRLIEIGDDTYLQIPAGDETLELRLKDDIADALRETTDRYETDSGLTNEQRERVYDAISNIERLTEGADEKTRKELLAATDKILSTCGVPDRVVNA